MFSNLLKDTCEIQRKTTVQNAIGESFEIWNSIFSVRCRFDHRPKAHKISDDNFKKTISEYVFFAEPNMNINIGDRVLFLGKAYNIVDLFIFNNDTTDHHIELYTEYIKYE